VSSVILSPVGTSLLSNFINAGESDRCDYCREIIEKYRDRDPRSWPRLSVEDERNRFPGGFLCSFVEGTDLFDSLMRFVEDVGPRACAELSGIEVITQLYGLVRSETTIVLLPTQTCNSDLCARVLEKALRGVFRGVEVVRLRSVGRVEDFEEFAIEVLDKVVKRVLSERRRGRRVFINAAPGFKAEVSFLVLASILAGATGVVYIHEAFREGIALPLPPIKLDRGRLEPLLRVLGDRECIDYGYALEQLGEEQVAELRDRGVVTTKSRGELCVRKWVRKLLELEL